MKKIYFLILCFFGYNSIFAQISITALGAPVTENFNSLANSGTSSTLPSGWAFSETGTNANTTYTAGTGSGTAGDTYSFGTIAADRAFGGLLSGTLTPTIGASFTNNTGQTITRLVIKYTGEQWRLGATGRFDRLDFQYSLDATSLATGTWTDVDALDFTAPNSTGTVGAFDGNNSANRSTISSVITGLSITNGSTFWIRWNDFNASSSDDGLGVDDFSLAATTLIDGTITGSEYGTHTNGQNQQSSATGTWYMSWDETNLYVALTGTNTAEGAVLYLDKDQFVPVNGGTDANGNLSGFNNYDGSSFANLQFRADLVVYFRDTYREYRTSDGAGGWSSPTTAFGLYSSASNTKEVSIPWSAIGGRPASFNWFGHVAYTGGGAYASMPTENPGSGGGLIIGSSARWDRYYTVSNTAIASPTPPFSRNSYTFTSASDVTSFGSISCYDFTMNSSGRFISRTGATNQNWSISGNMVLGNGIVYMGSGGTNGSYGTTNISGNLDIRGGELNLDQTTSSVNVNGNVALSSGNLILSGNSFGGGDLKVRGNWNYTGGSFTPNNRAVFFDAASGDQTITGTTTFDYLILDKAAGNLILASPISVSQTLTLTNGKVVLGANDLSLTNAAPSSLSAGSATSYVVTDGAGAFRRAIGTIYNGQDYFFPVGTAANRQPATINFNTISANNTLAARFITGSATTTGLPLTEGSDEITRVAFNGRWEINAAAATTDLYTGTYVANNFTDITDYTKLHLVKRADGSSPWVLDGTHVATTGSNLLATLQRTGMSGFSQFGVGGKSNVSLPVTLSGFSGYKDGSRNQLRWTTATEINNKGFDLQRSTDGISYTSIGFINSQANGGNSERQLNYAFTDNSVIGNKQYYRLRQEDLDGRSKLSNIVLIKGDRPTDVMIDGLYPNPAQEVVNVLVSVPGRTKLTVLVTDMAGRTLSQKVVSAETGSNTVQLNVGNLANGTYLVRLVCEDGCQPQPAKFIKQ